MRRTPIVWLGAALVSTGCLGPDCGNEVLREVISPDEARVATVFQRNCGATTPYVRVVMIRKKGTRFDGDDVEDFVFTMRGKHDIDVHWRDAGHLVISRPAKIDDIFRHLDSWEGTRISYTSDFGNAD